MTDLRDQLGDPIPLTDRHGVGHALWRLRHAQGITALDLAQRVGMSRSGIAKRETDGHVPSSALIEHAAALGYRVALIRNDRRETGTGWPA